MTRRTLEVQFTETWHVGTGRALGRHLDAVVHRDGDGLPAVPGRSLRGVLRDAAEALAAWGDPVVPAEAVARLFGSLTARDDDSARQVSRAGLLAVSDARLPAAERQWLAQPQAAAARAALFVASAQTAIDARSGTALEGSLRSIELAVPVTLQAEVEIAGADAAGDWAVLERALPLVRALGASKTRGHGRVRLAFVDEGGPA